MQKTLYLNTETATLKPDGDTLRMQRPDKSDKLIPLRRVERAVVQHVNADLLQACLAIIGHGGTVHFQDATGHLCGVLKHPFIEGTPWARELAHAIERSSGKSTYNCWLDAQQRHAWSLVFRNNYRGDFEANRKRLIKYLEYFQPSLDVQEETHWLEQQLLAWLQSRLNNDGLQPIARAYETKGIHLSKALMPCLLIPLLWAFVCWRKNRDTALIHEHLYFFEMQTHTRLYNQLQRHIQALESYYSRHWYAEEIDDTEMAPLEEIT